MITPVLLAKFFEGNCTPDEVARIEEWKGQSNANLNTFNRLKKIWDETGSIRPQSEVQATEAAWQKLKTQLTQQAPQKAAPRRNTLLFIVPRVAAVLLLVSMVIFYLVPGSPTSTAVKMIEISTQKGERRQLALADGSTIWLNAESTIKYPEAFDGNTREVYLDGEAYFDVAKNPSKPFKVHTNDVTTQVLGTSFNVLAYKEQPNIAVALDEGKVALSYGNETVDLEPGTKASFDKKTHHFNKTVITNKHNLWRNNIIDFDNITLAQAAQTIERWYGKKVVIENVNLQGCRITASFNNPTIDDVLEIISSTLSLQVEEKDGVYYLKGEIC